MGVVLIESLMRLDSGINSAWLSISMDATLFVVLSDRFAVGVDDVDLNDPNKDNKHLARRDS